MEGQTSSCLPAYRRSALWKGRGCFPGWYTFTVVCVTGLLMFSEAQGYILVGSVRPSHYMFLWSGFFLNGLLQLLPGSTQPLVPGIFLPHGLFSWLTRFYQGAPFMVITINERATHFSTKVTSRLLPCPLSFCPAIFLSQFSYLSAVVSGQINVSVGLRGQ